MDAAVVRLIHNLHHPSSGTPYQYVAVVTGGGAQAMAWLLGVPGASKAVLEVLVPYHQRSLAEFLGGEPEQNCSGDTSRWMARRALDRARALTDARPVAGVSCTASLATDRPKKGPHRFHISIATENGVSTWTLTLTKGARDREGEEAVLDAVLLNALAAVFGSTDRVDEGRHAGENVVIDNEPADETLALLYRGEICSLGRTVDGRWCNAAPAPGLVLAGSFNPLHEGHRGMAWAAMKVADRPIAFEITVDNVDKPSLIVEEVCRRARQFAGQHLLWLTRAPTFAAKAPLFPGSTFVVGYDTADRLVQEKYYGGWEQMHVALRRIRECGCSFLVAGRFDESRNRFLTLDDVPIPPEFKELFAAIPESAFRLDVSSTQKRSRTNT